MFPFRNVSGAAYDAFPISIHANTVFAGAVIVYGAATAAAYVECENRYLVPSSCHQLPLPSAVAGFLASYSGLAARSVRLVNLGSFLISLGSQFCGVNGMLSLRNTDSAHAAAVFDTNVSSNSMILYRFFTGSPIVRIGNCSLAFSGVSPTSVHGMSRIGASLLSSRSLARNFRMLVYPPGLYVPPICTLMVLSTGTSDRIVYSSMLSSKFSSGTRSTALSIVSDASSKNEVGFLGMHFDLQQGQLSSLSYMLIIYDMMYNKRPRQTYRSDAIQTNPFTSVTINPKIPDGRQPMSCGQRFQSVREVTCDAEGKIECTFFPGFNNGVVFNRSKGTVVGVPGDNTVDPPVSAVIGNAEVMKYEPHSTFILDESAPTPAQFTIYQDPPVKVARWRLVSQALRVSLVNACEESDGWFEAIRIQLPNESTSLQMRKSTTSGASMVLTVDPASGAVGPQSSPPECDLPATNWVQHPTYVSGKLKDIDKYIFQLRSQGEDHEFKVFNDAMAYWYPGFIDTSYDAIAIRINGRGGTETPSRLLFHVVSNQELVFDESSHLARFHSETHNYPMVVKRMLGRTSYGNNKAAIRYM